MNMVLTQSTNAECLQREIWMNALGGATMDLQWLYGKKVLSWLMLISGDSWMYPYQRTPMGNPYYYKPYISHANGMAEAYPVKDLQDGQKILWAWLWLQKSGDEKINALSGYLCRFDTWKIWYPIPLPMYPYGKPLGVFMGSYPQESLSTMGTLLGVHPIVPWLLGINKWLWHLKIINIISSSSSSSSTSSTTTTS